MGPKEGAIGLTGLASCPPPPHTHTNRRPNWYPPPSPSVPEWGSGRFPWLGSLTDSPSQCVASPSSPAQGTLGPEAGTSRKRVM